MKAWSVADMDVEPHHPLVLDSSDEGRLIVIELPAGEEMQEHRVHERAWLMVARGTIEIDDAEGETLGGGPGLVAEFNPNESADGARDRGRAHPAPALAVAGRGSPEPGLNRSGDERAQIRLEAGVADARGVHPVHLHPVARGQSSEGADHRQPVVAVR